MAQLGPNELKKTFLQLFWATYSSVRPYIKQTTSFQMVDGIVQVLAVLQWRIFSSSDFEWHFIDDGPFTNID